MIVYKENTNGITPDTLKGFFVGWKNYPSSEKLLQILTNSEYKIIAIDDNENKAAGFINALSDKVLTAYIPLLEVLPEYRGKGIGSQLVSRIISKLNSFYMIDIVCDDDLENFYSKFGFKKYSSMIMRNYDKQSGA